MHTVFEIVILHDDTHKTTFGPYLSYKEAISVVDILCELLPLEKKIQRAQVVEVSYWANERDIISTKLELVYDDNRQVIKAIGQTVGV